MYPMRREGNNTFIETAGKDDEVMLVNTLHRWNRATRVAELAVVVVLEDIRLGLTCPAGEFQLFAPVSSWCRWETDALGLGIWVYEPGILKALRARERHRVYQPERSIL